MKELFGATDLPCQTYSKVFEDNNGALVLAFTPRMTPCSKHITEKNQFFKDHVHLGNIKIEKVTSEQQVADCMTKGLEKTLFGRAHQMVKYRIFMKRDSREVTQPGEQGHIKKMDRLGSKPEMRPQITKTKTLVESSKILFIFIFLITRFLFYFLAVGISFPLRTTFTQPTDVCCGTG